MMNDYYCANRLQYIPKRTTQNPAGKVKFGIEGTFHEEILTSYLSAPLSNVMADLRTFMLALTAFLKNKVLHLEKTQAQLEKP